MRLFKNIHSGGPAKKEPDNSHLEKYDTPIADFQIQDLQRGFPDGAVYDGTEVHHPYMQFNFMHVTDTDLELNMLYEIDEYNNNHGIGQWFFCIDETAIKEVTTMAQVKQLFNILKA